MSLSTDNDLDQRWNLDRLYLSPEDPRIDEDLRRARRQAVSLRSFFLGKVETLVTALERAVVARGNKGRGVRLKQTLAGALITLRDGRISVEPAPPRRRRSG